MPFETQALVCIHPDLAWLYPWLDIGSPIHDCPALSPVVLASQCPLLTESPFA